MPQYFLEHSRTYKNVGARDAVECSKIFLRAGNNPVMLKNSTEHAEPLLIAFTVQKSLNKSVS